MAKKKPTSRYIAFLRGINVGGHRVKMDHLRDLFAALGFTDVATFIASGNVIFDAPAEAVADLERRIEGHLKGSLGYGVDTFLRTPAELAAVAKDQPFDATEVEAPGHTVHVAFLRDPLGDEPAATLRGLRTEMDEFRVQGRELYWLCRCRVSESPVSWPLVAKTLAVSSTMRNMKTVRQLVAKFPPQG